MAQQKHVDLLKQRVNTWNAWRRKHPDISPNLRGADLNSADLSRADLRGANLRGANLSSANLSVADLSRANLSSANLSRANLSRAIIGTTVFGDVDLRTVKGLETVQHGGPSTLGTDTLVRSQGDIPEVFLRGVGLPETFITYARSLVSHPIEYYTCFISYSSHDQDFAERLYADLQNKGVRCWFAPEDLKTGDFFWDEIDQSIRLYDKLLLVVSQHSVDSPWVRREVTAAVEKEDQRHQKVLFPLRLDETIMTTHNVWAADIRRQRQISDFTCWKEHDLYQKSLSRLLRDLQPDPNKNGTRHDG